MVLVMAVVVFFLCGVGDGRNHVCHAGVYGVRDE